MLISVGATRLYLFTAPLIVVIPAGVLRASTTTKT
jgi:hypothetical protein